MDLDVALARGTRVSKLTVSAPLGRTPAGQARFQCVCDCGEFVERTSVQLFRVLGSDGGDCCDGCARAQRSKIDRRCHLCGRRGHTKRSCALRSDDHPMPEREHGRFCRYCFDQPFRRRKSGCPGCHEPFAQESFIELELHGPGCALGLL